MKKLKHQQSTSNRFPLPKLSAHLEGGRSLPFRYAVGLVALFVPTATGCGENVSCVMTATCLPSDVDDGGTEDATADTPYDNGAVDDAEVRADHEPSDGGTSERDSAPDEGSQGDGTADRTDIGTVDGDARTDGAAVNDAALDRRVDTTSGMDANPMGDAADALGDAMPDATSGRSPIEEPCLIDEFYGSFVSPTGSDTSGKGTRAAPFQTIARGMRAAKLGGSRVFVCDNGTGYPDLIAADASTDGLAVYGGFDCKTWVPSASARTRVQPKSGPAMTASQLTLGITVENFDLRAEDAAAGATSIAAQINGSVGVVFRRSRIAAGKGGAGVDGQPGASGESGSSPGDDQRGRAPFCPGTPATQAGAVPVASTCGAVGGGGGNGSTGVSGSFSNAGYDGEPKTGVSPPNNSNAGTTCLSDPVTHGAADGSRGADGLPGAPGSPFSGKGTFSETGYAPAGKGSDGTPGHPGQGGGGGVGCFGPATCVGPSGGAGGAGGCGGKYGTGGGAGGASIGLLSWRSTIVLDGCELLSADGGGGGKGGNGGPGGKGAVGGLGNVGYDGTDPSGAGGLGGEGGPGAAGAGGNGGPTYALVFAGSRPAQMGTTLTISLGGPSGAGGTTPASPISTSNRAADGLLGDASYELAIP
jgi:hypothetical protein